MKWLIAKHIAGKFWGKSSDLSQPHHHISSKDSCKNLNKKINYWSLEEDQKLGLLANEKNYNWILLAKEFPNRTPDQIKKRWLQRFDSSTKKSPWTPEEDEYLKELYTKHGSNWKKISTFLPGRLPSTIKNRYYSCVRKKKIKSSPINENLSVCNIQDEDLPFDSFLDLPDNDVRELNYLDKIVKGLD
ncbi:hypothetical protein SteCoe_6342 [Stentor coeruleus]|uniref:Myb-like DNA-binding domain containing protein n=1 Tax=Stentor coeruleus TaxID=5963 RepID=A0A1R2CQ96_9CILI|nr:hypothetical protein SteCoe_6342 [Stentor coeruleus]